MGGRSIFVIEQGDKNANVIFETLTQHGARTIMAQRYLPASSSAAGTRGTDRIETSS